MAMTWRRIAYRKENRIKNKSYFQASHLDDQGYDCAGVNQHRKEDWYRSR